MSGKIVVQGRKTVHRQRKDGKNGEDGKDAVLYSIRLLQGTFYQDSDGDVYDDVRWQVVKTVGSTETLVPFSTGTHQMRTNDKSTWTAAESVGASSSTTIYTNGDHTGDHNPAYTEYQLRFVLDGVERARLVVPLTVHGADGKDGQDGSSGSPAMVWRIELDTAIAIRDTVTGNFLPQKLVARVYRVVGGVATLMNTSNAVRSDGYVFVQSTDGGSSWPEADVAAWQAGKTASALYTSSKQVRLRVLSQSNDAVVAETAITFTDMQVTGTVGPMGYLAGAWQSTRTYYGSESATPIVTYGTDADGDIYWYLDSGVTQSKGDTPSDSSKVWKKATHAQVLIAKLLFSEFAQLGSAIISGDYMYSMNGRIGSTMYADGALAPNNMPAYMWFKGDPETVYPCTGISKSAYIQLNGTSNPTKLASDIELRKGMKLVVNASIKAQANHTVRLSIKMGTSTDAVYKDFTDSTDFVDATLTVTASSDLSTVSINICDTGTWGYAYGTVEYHFEQVFEPNWWVDLRTGKMVAARGNFVVDGTGDVHVKSGDVDVSGTIRADNMFRTLAISSGGRYTSILNTDGSIEQCVWVDSSYEDTEEYGVEGGRYYTGDELNALSDGDLEWSNGEVDGFYVCTGRAELVVLTDNSYSAGGNFSGTVYLPRCQDYAGKTVEVRHTSTSGSNSATVKQVDGAGVFVVNPTMNLYNINYGTTEETSAIIEKGKKAIFYSTGVRWVRLEYS